VQKYALLAHRSMGRYLKELKSWKLKVDNAKVIHCVIAGTFTTQVKHIMVGIFFGVMKNPCLLEPNSCPYLHYHDFTF
jgi:hypothetical protein